MVSSVYPERACEQCGTPLVPHIYASGNREGPSDFARRRFCNRTCSNRFTLNGTVTTGPRRRRNAEERFWAFVDKDGPLWNGTPCWLWTGRIAPNGYGMFHVHVDGKTKNVYVHRHAYMLCGHTIPDGLDLDHRCRVRHCVNPAHLEPVSRAENLRRGQGMGGILVTHCPNGHPRTPDNLIEVPTRGRISVLCRICYTTNQKQHHERMRHRPPTPCRNCGELRTEEAKGLCQACYAYEYRTGRPRPTN